MSGMYRFTLRSVGLSILAAAVVAGSPIGGAVQPASAQQMGPMIGMPPQQGPMVGAGPQQPMGPMAVGAPGQPGPMMSMPAMPAAVASAPAPTSLEPQAYEAEACQGSAECPVVMRTNDGWSIDTGGPGILFVYDNED